MVREVILLFTIFSDFSLDESAKSIDLNALLLDVPAIEETLYNFDVFPTKQDKGRNKIEKLPPAQPEAAIDILKSFEIGLGFSRSTWDNDDASKLNGDDLDSTETSLFVGYDYALFRSKIGISQVRFDDALTFPATIFFGEAEFHSFNFLKYEFSDPTSILYHITDRPNNNRIGIITAALYGKIGVYSGWSNKDDIDRTVGNRRFIGEEEEKVNPSMMFEGGANFRLVLGRLGRLNMKVFTHRRVVKGTNDFNGSTIDTSTGNTIDQGIDKTTVDFEEIGGGVSFEYTRYLTDFGIDNLILHIDGGSISGTKSFFLIGLKFLL